MEINDQNIRVNSFGHLKHITDWADSFYKPSHVFIRAVYFSTNFFQSMKCQNIMSVVYELWFTNNVIQSTLSQRPLLISDHLPIKQPVCKYLFCFSVKYCIKNSLVDDHGTNFLSNHNHLFTSQIWHMLLFYFSRKRPPYRIVRKPLSTQASQKFSFLIALTMLMIACTNEKRQLDLSKFHLI